MNKIHNQSGFTMAEILVSMLILAVGLLGMAGLQVNGLRNNQNAYFRSQATILTYDLADRMRANPAGVVGGAYVAAINALPNTTPNATCWTTVGCTPVQMAQNDVGQWAVGLLVLPLANNPTLAPAGNGFSITLQWDDNKDGAVNGNDPTFQMSFQL